MPPESGPTARVAFAKIERRGSAELLPFPEDEALLRSIVPGTTIMRYARTWRMAQYRHEPPWLFGRIGFQTSEDTENWIEEYQDFVPVDIEEGITSPFAIYLPTLDVTFQLRGNLIRPTTFTSNLQALLDEASETWRWRVALRLQSQTWAEWRRQVDRIIEVRARLNRPNPNYHGRHQVESLVEGTGAKLVELVVRADQDNLQGLAVDAALLQEALDHAQEDQGSFQATGMIDTPAGPQRTKWRSEHEGAHTEAAVPVDPATGEASAQDLRNAIEQQTGVSDQPPADAPSAETTSDESS